MRSDLLHSSSTNPVAGPVSTTCDLAGLRVLVVDDSEINRELAACVLLADGACVELADNGQSAIDWLVRHSDDVDLVLMDVQMPVLDGCQATRCIRESPSMAKLPVMGLTGENSPAQIEAARRAGMNAILRKPFTIDQLRNSIADLLSHRVDEPARTATAAPALDHQVFDRQRGLRLWSEPAQLYQHLARFRQHYAFAESLLNTLLQAELRCAATAYLHKLKGSAGAVALNEIFAAASQLEQALRHRNDLPADHAAFSAALRRALRLIDELPSAPAEAAAPLGEIACSDIGTESAERLLHALRGEISDQIDEALQAAQPSLDMATFSQIRQRVDDFDLIAAEQLVEKWIAAQCNRKTNR